MDRDFRRSVSAGGREWRRFFGQDSGGGVEILPTTSVESGD